MLGWVIHCFKNFAVFKGRAGRPEYWWFYLFVLLVYVPIDYLYLFTARSLGEWLVWVWMAINAVPSLAVTTRRLHDTGRSFWWIGMLWIVCFAILFMNVIGDSLPKNLALLAYGVLLLLFFVLVIRSLALLATKGDPGANRYGGPPPTAPAGIGP